MLDDARRHPVLGATVRELERHGATMFTKPLPDGWVEVRLGYPDTAAWSKARGRSVPLGKFPVQRVLARPQG